ncbi:MAG: RnfABCDGE type electron transport complex subunit D [Oscillospiraceae bacterium]|nr:RnfABCDGE type electron transport complex subunit D [Oscillospiraceae bacterium]
MDSNLNISVSPHILCATTTKRIMLDVVIALLPAVIAGTLLFGLRALLVVALCVAVCLLTEFLFNVVIKAKQTIGDLSAVVTGVLLGLNLPANIPLWQAAIGSIFAILVVKCIFGGIGKNLFNPAIAARVFMLIAFGAMATPAFPMLDTISTATPLVVLKEGGFAPPLVDLFLGIRGGAIGETCVLALIIGGVYLLIRRVITWHIPVAFIATTFILTFVLVDFDIYTALSSIMSGGLFIGAIFMATDYTTSPSSDLGKLVFGIFAGLMTVLIRFWGVYPEGVSFAILLANILDPYIEVWTKRRLFGGYKK